MSNARNLVDLLDTDGDVKVAHLDNVPGSSGEANVQVDWSQTTTTEDDFIKSKPTTITTTQASAITANTEHKDSAHAPSGAQVNVKPNWDASTGTDTEILNKPSLFDGAYGSLSSIPTTFAPVIGNTSTTALAGSTAVGEANADDTAITTADTSWSGSQRATLVVDNDGSFDMNLGQNFKCSVSSGNVTLTFGSIANGQSGFILLINSGATMLAYAGSGGSGATKVDASLLTTISTAGTYLISYLSDGSNVYLTNSAIYT